MYPCLPEATDPVLTLSDSEFSSFDDALRKLELEEDDLKRLISAGEIRAFREGSKMRLRVEDVQRVAGELGIGGAVSEDDAGEVLEVEDLMLDDDGDAGMITTQLSEEDTLLDDDLDVVEVEDEGAGAAAGRSARGGRAAGGRARRGQEDEQAPAESGGMRVALVLTSLVLLFAVPFAIGMIAGHSTGTTSSIVGMFADEN